MAASLDLSQFTTVWTESFDSGTGLFSRAWGPGIDTSVPGQLTIHTTADNQDSGAMVPPTGASAGYGYGLYSFTLQTEGTVGVYALTWPATDVWPGPELDLLEITADGTPYTTIHWKGGDGSNQYQSYMMNGVDPSKIHTYAMNWQQGYIDLYVDGVLQYHITDHVPLDYAHGGENTAPGIGVQTWWNNGALGGNNWITIYDASYARMTGSGTGSTTGGSTGGSTGGTTTTTPVTKTIGSGADSLVLKISQDAYQGSAQYTVAVDGKQIGGTLTAGATHGAGDDSITVKGDFAAGNHTVTVTFLNDLYGGTSTTDRNLFVDGISFNGTALANGTASLLSNGGASFAFTKAGTAAGSTGGTTTPTSSASPATTGDVAPPAKFGAAGSWGQTPWEGHLPFGGTDYHTFGATGDWNAMPAAQMAPASWNSSYATHLAFDNFVQVNLDLHAAGNTPLDLMLVSEKRGSVTLGNGNDHVTWVAHSNASGTSANTMTIKTGAGDDVVHVTSVGSSPLADYDRTGNGSLYNPNYDGRYSTADVTLGSGHDTVTVETKVKLVLHAGSGAATATGGAGDDLFIAGAGTGDFTGGAGKDVFAFNAGDGHAVIQDFASGTDKLQFTGLHASDIHTKAATEGGVSGLLVTYDAAGDSVFLAHVSKLAATDMVFA